MLFSFISWHFFLFWLKLSLTILLPYLNEIIVLLFLFVYFLCRRSHYTLLLLQLFDWLYDILPGAFSEGLVLFKQLFSLVFKFLNMDRSFKFMVTKARITLCLKCLTLRILSNITGLNKFIIFPILQNLLVLSLKYVNELQIVL